MPHWTYFLSLVTLPLTYPNPFDRYGTPTPAFHVSTTEIGCTRVCVSVYVHFITDTGLGQNRLCQFYSPVSLYKVEKAKYTHFIMD